ncbi:2047_t:CDS:2 [Ambispora leptoticha]|uniref:2047_t:CDS:1 n=1 Tax=Ambispora leptoticha TaxID=144679 RepID=A0A9N8ZC49_9GLOM|nr:2047_t:CDS:2 [Ambispora leptoticha]
MNSTKVVCALHKHIPLIKFIGPRSKLSHGTTKTALHPAAPKGATLPDTSKAKNLSTIQRDTSKVTTQKQSSIIKSEIIDYSQLPEKYKRKGPTPEEIAAIETRAILIIRSSDEEKKLT